MKVEIKQKMRRGEVARHTELGSETIRYYEKIGLLKEPPRSTSNYREYPSSVLARIKFIQSTKKLGFSLDEIRVLLALRDQRDHPCQEIKSKATEKIDEINRKIEELELIRNELSALVNRCAGEGPTENCAILNILSEGAGPEKDRN